MSEAEHTGDNHAAPAKAKKGGMMLFLMVGVVCAVLGAAVPLGMSMMASTDGHGAAPAAADAHGAASGHGDAHGKAAAPAAATEMAIVQYGDVYTNLNDGRMNRYLRVSVSLLIRASDEKIVRDAVTKRNLIIRDWLVNHLADKGLEDVRGKAGMNMLRREIRDYFNSTLFTDSYDHVYEVLLTDFAIQ